MAYLVTINKDGLRFSYTAIGNRDDLIDAVFDTHGVCGITVMVQK
jgi:hypothetical protein